MQWVTGVARIFVRTDGRLVQVDLLPKGGEGHTIPGEIAESVERQTIQTSAGPFDCCLLAIGPLVTAKIKTHCNREAMKDYDDIRFACLSPLYGPQVKAIARGFRQDWKDCFLENIIERHPADEARVRWALEMPHTPPG